MNPPHAIQEKSSFAIGFISSYLPALLLRLIEDRNAARVVCCATQRNRRPAFKRWWTRVVPHSIERSTHVLFASLVLLFLHWQWRPMPEQVWLVHGWMATALGDFLVWLDHVSDQHFPDQSFRAFRIKPKSLPAFLVTFALPIHLPSDLSQLPACLLGNAFDDGRAFAVLGRDHRLHPDRHPAGRARDDKDLGDQYRRYSQHVAMLIPVPGRRFVDRRLDS